MSEGLTLVLVTWISFNFLQIFSLTIPCHETYQAQNGHQCYPCSKGFYKISDCVANGEQARCGPCANGEYQPSCDNSTQCVTCRHHCHPGQIKVKKCDATSDIKCECNPGSFWRPDPWMQDEGHCRQHSKCKDGEELVKEGTPYNDTVCLRCQDGVTYSNEATGGRCRACSVCNTTVIQPCNVTHDVICDRVTTEPPSSTYAPSMGLGIGGITGIISAVVILTLIIVAVVVYKSLYNRRNRSMMESRNTESKRSIGSNRNSSEGYHSDSETSSAHFSVESETLLNQKRFDKKGVKMQYMDKTDDTITQNNVTKSETIKACVKDIAHNKSEADEAEVPLQKVKTMFNNASDSERISPEEQFIRSSEARTLLTDENIDVESDISIDANVVSPRPLSFTNENGFPSEILPQEMNFGRFGTQTNDNQIQNLDDPTMKSNIFEDTGPRCPSRTSNECKDASENIEERIDTNENELQPQNRTNEESVWFETFVFLVNHLSFSQFRWFYRWLAERTNKVFKETIDVQIENSEENHKCSDERIYQLMQKWKQATPKASLINILNVLKEIKLCKIREGLLETLKSKKLLDESILDQCLNEEQNINGREVEPLGEHFFAKTMLPTDFGLNDETHRKSPEVATHQMMELKSTREDN